MIGKAGTHTVRVVALMVAFLFGVSTSAKVSLRRTPVGVNGTMIAPFLNGTNTTSRAQGETYYYSDFTNACGHIVASFYTYTYSIMSIRPIKVQFTPVKGFTKFANCLDYEDTSCGAGTKVSYAFPYNPYGTDRWVSADAAAAGTTQISWRLNVQQLSTESTTQFRWIEILTRLGAAGITSKVNINTCSDIYECALFDWDYCCVVVGAQCKLAISTRGASAVVVSPALTSTTAGYCTYLPPLVEQSGLYCY
jgi:hypothetical protein